MIKYDYGVLCESAIVDQQSNQLSLIKIVDGFNFVILPSVLPRVHLVTLWSREDNIKKAQTTNAKFSLIAPTKRGKVSAPSVEAKVEMLPDTKNLRVIMEVSAIPLTEVGEHNFLVEIKEADTWVEVGRIKFDVTNNPLPTEVTGLPQ